MGTTDSLKIENQELLKVLRKVWPEFSSIKTFLLEGRTKYKWRNIRYMEIF